MIVLRIFLILAALVATIKLSFDFSPWGFPIDHPITVLIFPIISILVILILAFYMGYKKEGGIAGFIIILLFCGTQMYEIMGPAYKMELAGYYLMQGKTAEAETLFEQSVASDIKQEYPHLTSGTALYDAQKEGLLGTFHLVQLGSLKRSIPLEKYQRFVCACIKQGSPHYNTSIKLFKQAGKKEQADRMTSLLNDLSKKLPPNTQCVD